MKFILHVFAALTVLLSANTVSAQSDYPNRPVRVV